MRGWRTMVAVAGVALLGVAQSARAQHAGFVLLPNDAKQAAANAVPAEQHAVHPVTSPYFNEDSFVTTDVRLWYLYHAADSKSLGGQAQVIAAQLRLAITDDLQFVAYKDGYTVLHTGVKGDGWNAVAAGLKYNFIQDWEKQFHMAGGVGYQFPWGESDVLQNKQEARVWLSANKGFDRLHLGAVVNYFHPTSQGFLGDSDHMSWHLHSDYFVCNFFSPIVEVNGFHVINDHNQVLPIQGADYTNFGDGAADTIITGAVGAEIRPMKDVAIRAAYEKDAIGHQNLFDWRITLSAVYSF